MDVYNIYQTEKMKSKLVDSNFDSKEYNRKENQFIVEFVKKSYRKQAVSCSVYVIFSLIIVMSLFLTQNPLSFLMIVPVILFAFFCSVQEKKIRSKTAFMEAEVANMRKES